MDRTSSRIADLSPERRALLEKRLRETKSAGPEPLAVVGLACRFPGGLASPDEYWDFVCRGGDAIGPVPPGRWNAAALDDGGASGAGLGGFLADVDQFDASFFGISPREAVHLDPQQRLLLEVGWEAFEDAGLTRDALSGSETGVFVGLHSHSSDYCLLQFASPASIDAFTGTGTAHNMVAGRLSYFLDLHGPALAVDTACSSSLVAIHLACQSLRAGECSIALAAGVNVILAPAFMVAATKMQMLSPDGHCRAFDAGGNGFVRSEGCGAVVLRRLSDAVQAGDRVFAVVRGSAINQDGRTNGITAPNGLAQRAAIRAALRNAGVDPAAVGLIEAHGTGTPLGDPIEAEALADVLGPARDGTQTVWLGSAKANVGHLEGAAGVAGFIKAVLSVDRGVVPPLGQFRALNPHIQIEGSRLAVPTKPTPWTTGSVRRVAGVSSFGWSGTNAHVVLEQAPPPAPGPHQATDPGRLHLVPVSGHSREAAAAAARAMAAYLESPATRAFSFAAICGTAAHRRTHHAHRVAVAAASHHEAAAQLAAYARGEDVRGVVAGEVASPRSAGLVFVFSGQGSQWVGMGRELLDTEPSFRQALEACDRLLRPWTEWSLLDVLRRPAVDPLWSRVDVIQPALFAVQVGLAALWRNHGVVPSAVVGHSMGEVAAAHVAGALDLETAARVIAARSRLLREISGQGAMALLELGVDQARAAIAGRERVVSIAAANSRGSTVISGDPAAVAQIVEELGAKEVFCRPIRVDVASHSPQVDPLAERLARELAELRPALGSVPMYSTVKAARVAGTELDAAYWAANLRQPVLLSTTTKRVVEDGFADFLEIAPHPILVTDIARDLQESPCAGWTAGSLRRDESERRSLLESLGAVFVRGHVVDWNTLVAEPRPPVDLPRYPWQRERFWLDESELSAGDGWSATRGGGGSSKVDDWIYGIEWVAAPSSAPDAEAGGLWLLVGDGTELAERAELAFAAAGAEPVRLDDGLAASLRRSEDVPDAERRLMSRLRALEGLRGVAAFCTATLADGDRATADRVEDTAAGSSLLVMRLSRAIADCGSTAPLWIATRGAQAVNGSPAASALAHAAAWGAGRVVAEEYPDVWGGLVDLDPNAPDDQAAAALAGHCMSPDGERQAAFRGVERLAARFVPSAAGRTAAAFTCRPDASYLVTGGLGGVGVEAALWLAARGARWIIVAGRTSLPPRETWEGVDPATDIGRRIVAVRRIEATGANVLAPAADVGDATQLTALHEGALAEGWPAVRGIIHAAGTTGDHLIRDVQAPSVLAVMRPKVRGAWLLHALTTDVTLDFCVWFSSLGSLIGQAGQASYASANAFMDVLAHHRRAKGLPATVVNWGAWAGRGMAVAAGGSRTVEQLGAAGIATFEPADGLAALAVILGRSVTQAAVVPLDVAAFLNSRWYRNDRKFFQRLPAAARTTMAATDARAPAVRASARAEILAAVPIERPAKLMALVRDELARVLRVPPERVGPDQPVGTLGLESLLAIELRNRLERALGLTLGATVLWNHPTARRLSAYLAERLAAFEPPVTPAAPAGDPPSAATTEPPGAPVREAAALSEDEALRALMKRSRG